MKKYITLIFVLVLTISCNKDKIDDIDIENEQLIELRSPDKFTLCHYNGTYKKLRIPENPLNNHLSNHSMDRIPGDTVTINSILYNLTDECLLVLANPIDGDGNSYETVTIGTQNWLTTNLRTTSYNDGSPIDLVEDNSQWSNLTTPANSWYNNDINSHFDTHGALYNYYAVADTITKNVCPIGWHIPTVDDFNELILEVGGYANAGAALKQEGTTNWDSPNASATNSSGYTALGSGNRNSQGQYAQFGHGGFYWSSTEYNTERSQYLQVHHSATSVQIEHNIKDIGFSVRCIED